VVSRAYPNVGTCWDALGMSGYYAFSSLGISAILMLGYVGMCGNVGILCFALSGHLAQPQCWDMLVGNVGILCFFLGG